MNCLLFMLLFSSVPDLAQAVKRMCDPHTSNCRTGAEIRSSVIPAKMEDEVVVLNTKLGQLKGQTNTSFGFNKRYHAFRGIPFGKPPVGDLRFKAPQPYGSWKGVWNALKDGNSCKQSNFKKDSDQMTFGDEDCLYLNIYINELPGKNCSKKPVMFFIHGGGFESGSGMFDFFGPDFILYGDVVLVSINYRCGPFGFLSLENEEVPGNAGLKDQTLALEWVRDNIDSFGGDSDNVTIFGDSAGGACVHYHLLSSAPKGLFHKAIVMSGFSNNAWALQPAPRKVALKLAKALGCNSEDNGELLQFLQSVPADSIVLATKKMSFNIEEIMKTLSLNFVPCVEVAGENSFLTDTPENMLKKGQFNRVPVIIGCAANEGSINELLGVIGEERFELLRESPELLVPPFVDVSRRSDQSKEAGKEILDFYFKEKPLSQEKRVKDLAKFVGDAYFYWGMETTRRCLLDTETNSLPVYTYLFTNHTRCFCAVGSPSSPEEIENREACHGADLFFISASRLMPLPEITPESKEAIRKHVKAWTRFAEVGDPNCEELGEVWRKDSWTDPCFMDIGTTWKMKDGIPFAERIDFWYNLAAKYSVNNPA